MRNILAEYFAICDLIKQIDYDLRKVWSFANKTLSKKKDNSHVFNMVTKRCFKWYFGFVILI